MYAESGDLAHGSQAGFETFVCLLHCDYCFLDVVLEHPVVVVFGEVAGKMQVRVDEARTWYLSGEVVGGETAPAFVADGPGEDRP